MKKRNVVVLGIALLAVGGIAIAQPTPTVKEPLTDKIGEPDSAPRTAPPRPEPYKAPAVPDAPLRPTTRPATPEPLTTASPAPLAEMKPEDLSIDQLLDGVESLRAQKEEIERREKAMLKTLRLKMEKLKARIDRLEGGALPPVTDAFPPPMAGGLPQKVDAR